VPDRGKPAQIMDAIAFYILVGAGSAAVVTMFLVVVPSESQDALTVVLYGALAVSGLIAIPMTRRFFKSDARPGRHLPNWEEWWLVPVVAFAYALGVGFALMMVGMISYLVVSGIGSLMT
jgi:hypothetical protein